MSKTQSVMSAQSLLTLPIFQQDAKGQAAHAFIPLFLELENFHFDH